MNAADGTSRLHQASCSTEKDYIGWASLESLIYNVISNTSDALLILPNLSGTPISIQANRSAPFGKNIHATR